MQAPFFAEIYATRPSGSADWRAYCSVSKANGLQLAFV
jgi:hypothetical protein